MRATTGSRHRAVIRHARARATHSRAPKEVATMPKDDGKKEIKKGEKEK
jgi:hypothetical protein